MRVAIVGGGAIGLGLAYELMRGGATVGVFERQRVGAATSRGNAGWITPALCTHPMAAPGVMRQAGRWMLSPNGPFAIKPRFDPAFVRWLLQFRAASSPSRVEAGIRALIAHNRRAGDALLRWQEDGVAFQLYREGLIFAALDDDALAQELAAYERLRELGFPMEFELLSQDAVQTREPGLTEEVIGGLFSPGEWHVRPETLTAGLASALRDGGAELHENTPVRAITVVRGHTHVNTEHGPFEADKVVIAAGVWSRDLLRSLGYRLPLEPGKGYSITAVGEGPRPRHALYLLEAKVACSPYDEGVRLVGALELGRSELDLSQARLRGIRRSAEQYLRWRPDNSATEWAGLRPLTPDGLPVLGAIPGRPDVFVATGHGGGGITLAAVSAQLLAPHVLGGPQPAELRPLTPARFA
jgi:D-amino-acid dehydrogenase